MSRIHVETVWQHAEHGYRLHASCRCGRSRWLDLARLIEEGHGDLRPVELASRLRCRACERRGLQVQRAGPAMAKEQAAERQRVAEERSAKVVTFRRRGDAPQH